MSHRPPKTMSRQFRKKKPLIFVFCEGESEQAYTQFLKEQFEDAAVIRYPRHPGLFSFALDKFSKDARYRNNAEVTDEICFFSMWRKMTGTSWKNGGASSERCEKSGKGPISEFVCL